MCRTGPSGCCRLYKCFKTFKGDRIFLPSWLKNNMQSLDLKSILHVNHILTLLNFLFLQLFLISCILHDTYFNIMLKWCPTTTTWLVYLSSKYKTNIYMSYQQNETVFLTHRYPLSLHNTDCEALNCIGGEGQPEKKERENRKIKERCLSGKLPEIQIELWSIYSNISSYYCCVLQCWNVSLYESTHL